VKILEVSGPVAPDVGKLPAPVVELVIPMLKADPVPVDAAGENDVVPDVRLSKFHAVKTDWAPARVPARREAAARARTSEFRLNFMILEAAGILEGLTTCKEFPAGFH
jgi:hypothetical protein